MFKRIPFAICCPVLVLLVSLLQVADAAARPVFGETWRLRQPDGSLVEVRIWGDEFYQVVESLDGYTLVRDDASQEICYARLSPDGERLESTGVRVGTASPVSLGLQSGLRVSQSARESAVSAARAQPLAAEPIGKLDYSPAITGNVAGLCLLVDFSDQVATIPRGNVEDFCNQVGYTGYSNNGSVRDYFTDVSEGHLTYTNWVAPAYHRASQTFAWYDDPAKDWLSRGVDLIYEILDAMDADGFDFSQYDANGDGYIDAINLFYAGTTTAGWAKGMWPGSGWIRDEWSADGVATLKFEITDMNTSLNIATYCHENGHMLGFWPDLYDYDKDSAGVGQFCLMCDAASGTNPVEPCAYLKYISGWGDVTTYADRQLGISAPTSSGNRIHKFDNPALSSEYWLVENRQRTGRDAAMPADGLAIWHVDTNGDHNANEMTPASHFLVTLVQADGDWDLENNVNWGEPDDLWRAPNFRSFTPDTSPATGWWDGTPSGMMFTNISASGPLMTFDFSPVDEPPVAVCKPFSVHPADGFCCTTVAVADIDGGSYDPNGAGDVLSLCITAVDGVDVGCQDEVPLCGVGSYELTLTMTDLNGTTASCTSTVELVNQAPVAVCNSHAANADGDCCITVGVPDIGAGSYDPDGAGDIASVLITAIDGAPVPGAETVEVCGNGLHAVTVTITDHCGAAASCEAPVEVIDVTPPEIDVVLSRQVLWPPNHKMAEITSTVTVSDNCDPDPAWVLAAITSNEPANGLGDGNTSADFAAAAFGTEDTAFSLRSERAGTGDARIYTIVYTATDASGNSASDTASVRVPHDQGGMALASTGFAREGTSFAPMQGSFVLLVPSLPARTGVDDAGNAVVVREAFDATKIDPEQAYVGNAAGVALPARILAVDADGDALVDLALVYEVAAVNALRGIAPGAAGESIEYNARTDNKTGALGLHYTDANGIDYLVGDIFALGAPVPYTEGRVFDLPADLPVSDKNGPAPEAEHVVTGLRGAYPNPFNPSTTISFGLEREESVALRVYDVHGRLVRTLAAGTMPAGLHDIVWDGNDDGGGRAATGIYLVNLVAGRHQSTGKLVLVK